MQDTLLIGVDGGATEAKAHAVTCEDWQTPAGFRLRDEQASRVYPTVADFVPVPVTDQFSQRNAGDIRLTEGERTQGTAWIAATAEAIGDVAKQCGAQRILVGVGMPGLKTPDGRGICVINNGPRLPEYLDQLESKLADAGLTLAAPVAALGSDADYCGLGEEFAADGLFRDVSDAYYFGGGTGIADAMKLDGELVRFDQAKAWLQKSWQLASAMGPTFEKLISAKSLNAVYAGLRPDGESAFPEAAAATGDPIAQTWLRTASMILAELVFERLWTIKNGRASAAHRGDAYQALETDHPHRGTVLQRVIIGQRIGQLYANPDHHAAFAGPFEQCLARLISQSDDRGLINATLRGPDQLKPGLVQASKLRAAPALGAAVAAARSATT
jgi:hypothetical protein